MKNMSTRLKALEGKRVGDWPPVAFGDENGLYEHNGIKYTAEQYVEKAEAHGLKRVVFFTGDLED